MRVFANRAFAATVCVVLLCAVAAALFSYTVRLRRPWFGTTGTLDAGLTAGTLLVSKQWYREGMLRLRAGVYCNPRSIEFPTLASRGIRSSYPPGAVVPLHCFSILVGHEPTISLLMAFNLLNHFLIAVLLSLTVFVLLRQMHYGYPDAFVLSLAPILLELLLPAPFYHHQMGFFPEQAVILLFVLYVFLEVVRDGLTGRRLLALLSVLQGLVAFLGILTDWLFAFVALCVYLKRVARGGMGRPFLPFVKRSVAFWFSFGLALLLFAAQLWSLDQFQSLWQRFAVRTGMTSRKPFSLHPYLRFCEWHMVRGYGKIGVVLLCATLIGLGLVLAYACLRRIRRKEPSENMSRALGLTFMLSMPCFLHLLLLKNHSAHPFHYFAALKFSVPLATVPFVLTPVLVLSCLNADVTVFSPGRLKALVTRRPRASAARWSLLPLLLMALAGGYVYEEHPRILPQFNTTIQDKGKREIADFIDANTGYEDVVFAWHKDLRQTSAPLYLAFSMKRVYAASTVQRVYDKVGDLEGDYVVNIVSKPGAGPPKDAGMKTLLSRAHDTRTSASVRLCKIRKARFLALCHELGIAR